MLTRISFLAPQPQERQPFVVPGLGRCFVRVLSAGERDAFEVEHHKADGKDFRARLIFWTVCDEDGGPAFERTDIPALSALPAATLQPLILFITGLNRLGPEDIKDLEEASKNSSSDRNGNSSSVSRSHLVAPSAS